LLPTSTVKPLRHAVYDATLTERTPEFWAGAYRSSRKKNTLYKPEKWTKRQNSLYQYPLQQGLCTRKANTFILAISCHKKGVDDVGK